jgi:hypothetical protein
MALPSMQYHRIMERGLTTVRMYVLPCAVTRLLELIAFSSKLLNLNRPACIFNLHVG